MVDKPSPWTLVHRSLAAILRRVVALEHGQARATAASASRVIASTSTVDGKLVVTFADGSSETVGTIAP